MEQTSILERSSNAPFMEHRWGQRMPCRARVGISGVAGAEGNGSVRDISSSGAFIETTCAIPVHSRIVLTVTGNSSAERTTEIAATVVRLEKDGFGLEWCDTPSVAICTVVGCRARCDAIR